MTTCNRISVSNLILKIQEFQNSPTATDRDTQLHAIGNFQEGLSQEVLLLLLRLVKLLLISCDVSERQTGRTEASSMFATFWNCSITARQ